MAIATLVQPKPAQTDSLTQGLLAHWPLGDTPHADIIGGSHFPTTTPLYSEANGPLGGMSVFRTGAPTYGITNSDPKFGLTTPMSAAIWVCPKAGGLTTNSALIGKWDSNGWMLYYNGGNLYGYANGTNPNAAITTAAGVPFLAGYTWDGATIRVYFNGREIVSSAAGTLSAASAALEIGNYNNSGAGQLNANFTGASVWKRALSPGEMLALYTSRTGLHARLAHDSAISRKLYPSRTYFTVPSASGRANRLLFMGVG